MRFDEVNKGLRVEKRRGSQTELQSILRFRGSGKEKEKKKDKKERTETWQKNQESVVTWMPKEQRELPFMENRDDHSI